MRRNAEIDTAEIDTTEIMSSVRWKQTEKVGKLIRNKRRDARPEGKSAGMSTGRLSSRKIYRFETNILLQNKTKNYVLWQTNSRLPGLRQRSTR
jgi:hypothetical protein